MVEDKTEKFVAVFATEKGTKRLANFVKAVAPAEGACTMTFVGAFKKGVWKLTG